MEPSIGQGDDRLFALLDEIAERRKAAQAQLNANRETESAQLYTIDVKPVDAGKAVVPEALDNGGRLVGHK